MKIRTLLKVINGGIAGIIVIILMADDVTGFAWVPFLIASTLAIHFGIDALVSLRRLRYRQRFRDLSEFADNHPYEVTDLQATFKDDKMMASLVLPALIEGTVQGQDLRQAPLSERTGLAWRLEAELLDGMQLTPDDDIPVELASWWGKFQIKDETGAIAVEGPGLLDSAGLSERICSLRSLKSQHPELAAIVADRFGIGSSKAEKARFVLREVILSPGDAVRVYGQARFSNHTVSIGGCNELDDPAGLFIRSTLSPASSRRSIARIRSLFTLSAAALSGLILVGLTINGLFGEGGLFDSVHQGPIQVNADGRPWRITQEAHLWDFASGDLRTAVELQNNDQAVPFRGTAKIQIQRLHTTTHDVEPGAAGYPRWDGKAWTFTMEPSGPLNYPASAAADTATPHSGKIYLRNLSDDKVTIRILDPSGQARDNLEWSYQARAWADSPEGSWLSRNSRDTFAVAADDRIELTTSQGYRRILAVNTIAKWRDEAWHLDLVGELMAGPGKIHVRNNSNQTLQIWLIGADGEFLHGQLPWEFDAKEGSTSNRGSALQVDSEDISFTGRETIRYGLVSYQPVFDGQLDQFATWQENHWLLEAKNISD